MTSQEPDSPLGSFGPGIYKAEYGIAGSALQFCGTVAGLGQGFHSCPVPATNRKYSPRQCVIQSSLLLVPAAPPILNHFLDEFTSRHPFWLQSLATSAESDFERLQI